MLRNMLPRTDFTQPEHGRQIVICRNRKTGVELAHSIPAKMSALVSQPGAVSAVHLKLPYSRAADTILCIWFLSSRYS